MCIQLVSQVPLLPTCEPLPAECDGQVECTCAGTLVCTGIFSQCHFAGEQKLECSCPDC
jgi:hypothetical protein